MCAGGEKILRKQPSSFPGQVPGELRVLHPGAFPGIPAGAKHELRKGKRRRAGRAGSSQQMQVSPQQDFPAAGFCLIPSSSQVFCPVFLARWLHLTHGVSSLGFFWAAEGSGCVSSFPLLPRWDTSLCKESLRSKSHDWRLGGAECWHFSPLSYRGSCPGLSPGCAWLKTPRQG